MGYSLHSGILRLPLFYHTFRGNSTIKRGIKDRRTYIDELGIFRRRLSIHSSMQVPVSLSREHDSAEPNSNLEQATPRFVYRRTKRINTEVLAAKWASNFVCSYVPCSFLISSNWLNKAWIEEKAGMSIQSINPALISIVL
jgi:hypothetical protein